MTEETSATLASNGDEFKENEQFKEAIHYYLKAIELEKRTTNDGKFFAKIYSRCAQSSLDLEEYEEALEFSNESLKYDATSETSLILRSMANSKLGNLSAIVVDMRKVFSTNPMHPFALHLIKRARWPKNMKSRLCSTFVAHSLRRHIVNLEPEPEFPATLAFFDESFLLRLFTLSKRCSKCLKPFLNGSLVTVCYGFLQLYLPGWFVVKRMKFGATQRCAIIKRISIEYSNILFETVKPLGTTAFIHKDFYPKELDYSFERVIHTSEHKITIHKATADDLESLEVFAKLLTKIAYSKSIINFKDTCFPKLNCIVVPRHINVDTEFLKLWVKNKWRVNTLVFQTVPNKETFENFTRVISNVTKKVFIPISDELFFFGVESVAITVAQHNKIEEARNGLEDLKRYFPKLDQVNCTMKYSFPNKDILSVINGQFKQFVAFLSKSIDSYFKPNWCKDLKISVEFCAHLDSDGKAFFHKKHMDCLKNIFEEIKNEWKNPRLSGPSELKFVKPDEDHCCFAKIELETSYAQFEIFFSGQINTTAIFGSAN